MRSLERLSPSVVTVSALLCVLTLTLGCGTSNPQNQTATNTSQAAGYSAQVPIHSTYVSVERSAYDATTHAVTLWVHPVHVAGWKQFFSHSGPAGERVIDTSTEHGVGNYAVSEYPAKRIRAVHLVYSTNPLPQRSAATVRVVTATRHAVPVYQQASTRSRIVRHLDLGEDAALVARLNRSWYQVSVAGQTGYVTANPNLVRVAVRTSPGSKTTYSMPGHLVEPAPDAATTSTGTWRDQAAVSALAGSRLPAGSARSGHIPLPPPGTSFDRRISWRAPATASVTGKENAVISVAQSKLGTPYIWGHNEDRGQYGFDCSNYTSYVYHHALGYRMTGSSRGQASYVGVRIPKSDMRVGDLLIFEYGKHVGIYAGNQRMIQEGGGLGKCGYLSIGPGSYWGKHLTAVKRMF